MSPRVAAALSPILLALSLGACDEGVGGAVPSASSAIGPATGSSQARTQAPPLPGPTPIVPGRGDGRDGPLPRVLPLGDSITYGTGVPGGYRLPLSGLLDQAGEPIDFVGTLLGNNPPDFDDPEHQGHVAWTTSDLMQFDGNGLAPDSSIEQILEATEPESILLHIGTNDMLLFEEWQLGAERLDELLDRIWSFSPEARVFVATIVPTGDAPTNLTVDWFNARLRELLWERFQDGYPVRLVDMGAGLDAFSLADGVHPTAAGYQAMAEAWAAAWLAPDEPVPAPVEAEPQIAPVLAIATSFQGGYTPGLAVNGAGLDGELHLDDGGDVPLGWRSEPLDQVVDAEGFGTPVGTPTELVLRLPGVFDVKALRIWNGRNQTFDGEAYVNRESVRRVHVETSRDLSVWVDQGELVLTQGAGRLYTPFETLDVDWDRVRVVRLTVLETYGNLAGQTGPITNPVSLAEVQVFGEPSPPMPQFAAH